MSNQDREAIRPYQPQAPAPFKHHRSFNEWADLLRALAWLAFGSAALLWVSASVISWIGGAHH